MSGRMRRLVTRSVAWARSLGLPPAERVQHLTYTVDSDRLFSPEWYGHIYVLEVDLPDGRSCGVETLYYGDTRNRLRVARVVLDPRCIEHASMVRHALLHGLGWSQHWKRPWYWPFGRGHVLGTGTAHGPRQDGIAEGYAQAERERKASWA